MEKESKESVLVWLTLLFSSSTLICCTIPILMIALGFGATIAYASSQFHWWITLTEYKFYLFLISGTLLLISFWILKRTTQSCPTDPVLAKYCLRLRRWNIWVFRLSILIWIIGFASAYLAVPLSAELGN